MTRGSYSCFQSVHVHYPYQVICEWEPQLNKQRDVDKVRNDIVSGDWGLSWINNHSCGVYCDHQWGFNCHLVTLWRHCGLLLTCYLSLIGVMSHDPDFGFWLAVSYEGTWSSWLSLKHLRWRQTVTVGFWLQTWLPLTQNNNSVFSNCRQRLVSI